MKIKDARVTHGICLVDAFSKVASTQEQETAGGLGDPADYRRRWVSFGQSPDPSWNIKFGIERF